MTRILVVGGGAAGMTAASVAKRRDPDLEITVAEAGGHVSFSACGMPYWLSGTVPGPDDTLVVVSAQEAREERGLDVRLGTRVTALDADARTAVLESEEGRETFAYDEVVLATGARADQPFEVPAEGVFALRHLDDGVALRRHLETHRPKRACVVGGGFVGLEMAEAFADLGLETRLVHSRDTLLHTVLDPESGGRLGEAVQAAGVDLVLGQRVQGVSGEPGALKVEAGGESFETDLVVLGLGVQPETRLAEAAGVATGPGGALLVDATQRTGVEGVWAAGDSVAVPHRVTGEPMFLPLALHANRMGRIVGQNLTGGEARFPGVLGTLVTRFRGTEVGATGLTEVAAREAGIDPVAATIRSGSKAGYFPGSQKIQARIVADAATGRVLGAQTVGGTDTAKRIDTMAAAVWMGATLEEVEAFDLAYAPPFGPVWDAWAIAARMAQKER